MALRSEFFANSATINLPFNRVQSAFNRVQCVSLLFLLFILSPLGHLSAADAAAKRHSIVYLSDGTQLEGIVQLSPGIDFTMTKLPSEDKTTGTVDSDAAA